MTILAFFYILRAHGIKVTLKEWMDLCALMKQGQVSSLSELYFIGKKVLVKSEKLYDIYDKAYLEFIGQGDPALDRLNEILELMDEFKPAEGREFFSDLGLEEILKRFNERLMNQRERHAGGGKHIGTGGYSPFGHSGAKRDGIRVGGEGMHGQAFYVASERHFKNLREDVYLDTRNTGIALKKLRTFQNIGCEEEVDIDGTVDKTAQNFGDIEIIFKRERKNNVKLLLLIDNGGSMDPYRDRVERLFSIAKQLRYFKDFRHYYFHNCIYDNIYTDTELWEGVPTARVFKEFNADWKVIFIGDALMSPYELHNSHQFIYRMERKGKDGYEWLKSFRRHFRHAIWLNPISGLQWQHQTLKTIQKLFPMFPLTLEGIEKGVKELLKPQ
jgi:uncharacterized protein with von Willebrand factor type A (vWA) domain